MGPPSRWKVGRVPCWGYLAAADRRARIDERWVARNVHVTQPWVPVIRIRCCKGGIAFGPHPDRVELRCAHYVRLRASSAFSMLTSSLWDSLLRETIVVLSSCSISDMS